MFGPHVFGFEIYLESGLENLEAKELGVLLRLIIRYEYTYREDVATKQHILRFGFKNQEIRKGQSLCRSLKEKGFNVQTFVIL